MKTKKSFVTLTAACLCGHRSGDWRWMQVAIITYFPNDTTTTLTMALLIMTILTTLNMGGITYNDIKCN
jgi:hypothetical protein